MIGSMELINQEYKNQKNNIVSTGKAIVNKLNDKISFNKVFFVTKTIITIALTVWIWKSQQSQQSVL